MSFAVCVTFTLYPAKMADFLPLMYANAKASLANEKGCLRFDVLTDPQSSTEVFLYELYEDAAAFDVHLASWHFLEFDGKVRDMIADKNIKTYAEVVT